MSSVLMDQHKSLRIHHVTSGIRHPVSVQEVNGHKATKKGLQRTQQELQEARSLKSDLQKMEQQVVSLRSANTSLKQTLAAERVKASQDQQDEPDITAVIAGKERVATLVRHILPARCDALKAIAYGPQVMGDHPECPL
jgi:regulator of replication initiation timing